MPRKRAATTTIAPPQLPAGLSSTAPPATLEDQASFTQCMLHDGDFTEQSAEDVLFEQVLWRHVSLNQAELRLAQLLDVQFDGCDLAGSAWEKLHARRVELRGCRLVGIKLLDSSLEDVLIHKCNGELARFWSTSLKAVRFEQCLLREASFVDSNLSGVVFRDCDLSQADLRGTTLRDTDLRGSTLAGVQVGIQELQGAIIDAAQVVQLASLLGVVVKESGEA